MKFTNKANSNGYTIFADGKIHTQVTHASKHRRSWHQKRADALMFAEMAQLTCWRLGGKLGSV